jgi:hypothetical protein
VLWVSRRGSLPSPFMTQISVLRNSLLVGVSLSREKAIFAPGMPEAGSMATVDEPSSALRAVVEELRPRAERAAMTSSIVRAFIVYLP